MFFNNRTGYPDSFLLCCRQYKGDGACGPLGVYTVHCVGMPMVRQAIGLEGVKLHCYVEPSVVDDAAARSESGTGGF